jgi:hypothetical protein
VAINIRDLHETLPRDKVCHDQADAQWIVIRWQLRGPNDTPFGQPTTTRPIGRPGAGDLQGVLGVFSNIVILFAFFMASTPSASSRPSPSWRRSTPRSAPTSSCSRSLKGTLNQKSSAPGPGPSGEHVLVLMTFDLKCVTSLV